MRAPFLGIAFATLWVAAAVACATSNDEPGPPGGDGGQTVVPDGATTDDAPDPADPDASTTSDGGPLCSSEGWCNVPLSDKNLSIVDIWPLAGRAFALAKSPFLGVKVLEWDGAAKKWSYIDDDTQNEIGDDGFIRDPSSIWAITDDDVYFTTTSTTSGYVYHGKRPVPPATAWSWTPARFPVCSYAKLWVYGTGENDVYAGSCNTIYRKGDGVDDDAGMTDGGPSGWAVDHVEIDPASDVSFLGASGVGPDDVWFAGGRRTARGLECALVLHRTAAGYERIVDSTADNQLSRCVKQDGIASVGGLLHFVQRVGQDRIVAFARASSPVRILPDPDGGYVSAFGKSALNLPGGWKAAWAASEDEFWVGRNIPTGQVMYATNLWSDAGTYEYSSIALNGSPILSTIVQIRGTSTTNLWAVGGNYVFQKTTP